MVDPELKKKIDQAEIISFDVFDTLLFRMVNSPETIFDLLGKKYSIPGFRKLRKDAQNEASRRAYEAYQYPHAMMDQIYDVLSEKTEISDRWPEIKNAEIEMEKDSLRANHEMMEVYRYAQKAGKRIIAVTDMYLTADIISDVLAREGYQMDAVYCSADEHKAKFNQQLFREVIQREKVAPEKILHIGDNLRDDVQYPTEGGISTFHYQNSFDMDKIRDLPDSDMDKGLCKMIHDESRGFWYNLGAEVGGPLYMGLTLWMTKLFPDKKQKLYFLSRDGYNLAHIFRKLGYSETHYLYASRRSLVLSGISEMNDDDIQQLPPYTTGQTVGEVLDYLCIPRNEIHHLSEAGFDSFDDLISEEKKYDGFRKLYRLDKDVFLKRCEAEREQVRDYFASIGFLEGNAAVFDCGWNGSSQFLLEKLLKQLNYQGNMKFYYFGILNTEKSRKQLHSRNYEAFTFDFYRNYHLQPIVRENPLLYELFFSAPHGSVLYYQDRQAVLEKGPSAEYKNDLLDGIEAYVVTGIQFAEKYHVEYDPDTTVSHLNRMILNPTEEEAQMIGNIENPDGFSHSAGGNSRIAFVEEKEIKDFKATNLKWMQGIFRRPDIAEGVKHKLAVKLGISYPSTDQPQYHLEYQGEINNYHRWISHHSECYGHSPVLSYQPLFSVVIPVYNTVSDQLREAIDSVLAQSYRNFELILVDDHSSMETVKPVLQSYESSEKVKVIYRTVNGNISVATNDGIQRCSGEYIAFMDCDDVIEPDALYQFAAKLNENPELDFIYSDEDKITEDGRIRHLPFFKPDWSPDLFLSMMYTNHLGVYRTSIVRKLGGLRTEFNGSQDYDMSLRFLEHTSSSRIGHIPEILYHWRERKESVAFAMSSKNYASEAALEAKRDYFRRNHIPAKLEVVGEMSQGFPVYATDPDPLVSIIILSKDHAEVLFRCIDSICRFTDYQNYEVIVVDNGSTDLNKKQIEAYLSEHGCRYLYQVEPFNFSEMCNIGAKAANGDYLLFLNDDVEFFSKSWLSRMLGQAMQPHTGAVGAKLFYPETTMIQHCGVTSGCRGPEHSFIQKDDSQTFYFGWNRVVRDCLSVTAACMLLSKGKFEEAGRFDESFPVAYNDVELCYRLYEKGYYNVLRNDAVAYHHESLSRGSDAVSEKKYIQLMKDLKRLYQKHPQLECRDPFLNRNLRYYGSPLSLEDNSDEMQLSHHRLGRFLGIRGNVDVVNHFPLDGANPVEDKVEVSGWSFLADRKDNQFLKRYLLLRDPFRTVYRIPVHPVMRPDVAKVYDNREDLVSCGFECLVSKKQLRMDYIPYELGIEIDEPNGKVSMRWLGKKNDVVYLPEEGLFAEPAYYLNAELCRDNMQVEKDSRVRWNIDEAKIDQDGVLRIIGWAYLDEKNHYQYQSQILLRDDEQKTFRIGTLSCLRPDVAMSNQKRKYLYQTGFRCALISSVLPENHSYEIFIELVHQFGAPSILVETGRSISL